MYIAQLHRSIIMKRTLSQPNLEVNSYMEFVETWKGKNFSSNGMNEISIKALDKIHTYSVNDSTEPYDTTQSGLMDQKSV